MNQLANEGHVYAEEEQLVQAALELLEADEAPIREALNNMVQTDDLKLEDEAIYLPPFYFAEVGTTNRLQALLRESEQNLFAKKVDVQALSKETGIEYDEVQLQAIEEAIRSKVMVLTGGPGTGKTTTTQGIIAALKHMGLRILLAAPTGRAAKRMSEATGMESKTIHRLLEFNPKDGYKRNDENPLEGDALIVDECSMIDIILMNNLMKAIPSSMRVVFVGDIDQLPSVGAGNVLRDIIESEKIPVIRLTRIFRQAQTSRIVMSAHAINQGRFPDTSNGKQTDFFFHPTGGAGEGGGGNCESGEEPPAESLQPRGEQHSGFDPHATRCGGCCQSEHGLAKCTESFPDCLEQGRLFLPSGRPGDAAAQQLRQGCVQRGPRLCGIGRYGGTYAAGEL